MPASHRIVGWLDAIPVRRRTIASVGLVVIVFMFAGWSSMTGLGDSSGYDSGAFKEYAETVRETGRLPTPAENYEYSLPPGYPFLGAYLDRFFSRLSFDAGRPFVTAPMVILLRSAGAGGVVSGGTVIVTRAVSGSLSTVPSLTITCPT